MFFLYNENMIYLEEQLNLIRHLQEWRGPVFDAILRIFNFFDTFPYYSGLVAFIWVGVSWRWGVRLGFLLVVNGVANMLAKMAFALPRPLYYDPSLAVIKLGGYGFPSGGAQTAMLFGALLAYYWKSRWAWPCAALYVLSISLSRVLLGVHFVTDVLGGWVLGLLVAILFIYAVRPIEAFASKYSTKTLAAFVIFVLLAWAILPAKLSFLMAVAVICAVGVYLSTKYGLYFTDSRKGWRKILHGLVGIAGAAFLGQAAKMLFPLSSFEFLVEACLGALWVSLLASPFCKRVL